MEDTPQKKTRKDPPDRAEPRSDVINPLEIPAIPLRKFGVSLSPPLPPLNPSLTVSSNSQDKYIIWYHNRLDARDRVEMRGIFSCLDWAVLELLRYQKFLTKGEHKSFNRFTNDKWYLESKFTIDSPHVRHFIERVKGDIYTERDANRICYILLFSNDDTNVELVQYYSFGRDIPLPYYGKRLVSLERIRSKDAHEFKPFQKYIVNLSFEYLNHCYEKFREAFREAGLKSPEKCLELFPD